MLKKLGIILLVNVLLMVAIYLMATTTTEFRGREMFVSQQGIDSFIYSIGLATINLAIATICLILREVVDLLVEKKAECSSWIGAFLLSAVLVAFLSFPMCFLPDVSHGH